MKIGSILQDDTGLYHASVGFPKKWIDYLPRGFSPRNVYLKYGSHAREEAMKDRYGDITLPRAISFTEGGLKIIEMEIQGQSVTKLVVRMSYDADKDITIVFNPADGFVRTVWLNEKTDTHKTLDKSKYRVPDAR